MTSAKTGDRSYKRSWKNLLLNKRYQLRFTLFMVGLSALLMVGLGIWVMWVADETNIQPMTFRCAYVLQDRRSRISIIDNDIQPSITIEIAHRHAAGAPSLCECAARGRANSLKFGLAA